MALRWRPSERNHGFPALAAFQSATSTSSGALRLAPDHRVRLAVQARRLPQRDPDDALHARRRGGPDDRVHPDAVVGRVVVVADVDDEHVSEGGAVRLNRDEDRWRNGALVRAARRREPAADPEVEAARRVRGRAGARPAARTRASRPRSRRRRSPGSAGRKPRPPAPRRRRGLRSARTQIAKPAVQDPPCARWYVPQRSGPRGPPQGVPCGPTTRTTSVRGP